MNLVGGVDARREHPGGCCLLAATIERCLPLDGLHSALHALNGNANGDAMRVLFQS